MKSPSVAAYRTTRDIVVPKGNRVIFVSHIRKEAYRLAQSLVSLKPDMLYTWEMDFEDALRAGLIEKVPDADPV